VSILSFVVQNVNFYASYSGSKMYWFALIARIAHKAANGSQIGHCVRYACAKNYILLCDMLRKFFTIG